MTDLTSWCRWLHAFRSDWRDLTTALLALLAALLCIAGAFYRLSQDDKASGVILGLIGLGVAIFGLLLAARKLREHS